MHQGWRWFGPSDEIQLRDIRQFGVTDVVTALHHVQNGDLWTDEEIKKRQQTVECDSNGQPSGLKWSVVESVPIHEDIKTRSGDWTKYIEVYKESLRNLAKNNIKIVCYNFMPVLDWTRTEINMPLKDGSKVLLCEYDGITMFDLFVLKRAGAEQDYTADELERANTLWSQLDDEGKKGIEKSILMGLPGTVDDLSIEEFQAYLDRYKDIDDKQLRANLYDFMNEIMPTCEELGIRMAIHPDDPPRNIFGLPRIMSTLEDAKQFFREVPSMHNGITLCTGSFGGRRDNSPSDIFEAIADRVFFAHFRNVTYIPEKEKSFYESNHLYGHVDMVATMTALIKEEERRKTDGWEDWQIVTRPDHGKLLDCDPYQSCYGGYSAIGRAIGLAELRGLECGLRHEMKCPLPPVIAT